MSKKTLIMAGVLIVLVGLAVAYEGPIKKWQNDAGKPKNHLAKYDFDKLEKIQIVKLTGTTTLERRDDGWQVAGADRFKADQQLIDALKSDLKTLKDSSLELVSSNRDKQMDFQIGIAGIGLKLYFDDGKDFSFNVGKMGNDFSSAYIAWIDSPETYLAKVNIRNSADSIEWRDRKIFASDQAKITKVRFQYPKSQFTIEKKDDKWMSGKTALKSEQVDKILGIMANLQSAEIPSQDFKGTGLEKNSIIVQATGDGIDNTLMVGDKSKDKDMYFAKKGDSDNIYLITMGQRDTLNTSINGLK